MTPIPQPPQPQALPTHSRKTKRPINLKLNMRRSRHKRRRSPRDMRVVADEVKREADFEVGVAFQKLDLLGG